MTCRYCAEKSGVHDMTKACCASRFLMAWPGDQAKTAAAICERYGHNIEDLRAAARKSRAVK